ncbi:MAG: HupE/UreJ family protein [Alphaproteobacteria bacterium]
MLLPENPSHLHFARATLPDGRVVERILGETDPRWALDPGDGSGAGPRTASSRIEGARFTLWISIGADHLLTGTDHLAFLAALLLLANTMAEVAAALAAYAIATSLGLAAAGLGLLAPPPAAVGALVGFSVAIAATEDSWQLSGKRLPVAVAATLLVACLGAVALRRSSALGPLALGGLALFTACRFGLLRESPAPSRLRSLLAFAFGLVHGLGFAPAVAGLELPPERLVPALLGFTLGIVAALLAAAAIAWPLFRLGTRLAGEAAERATQGVLAGALAGLGLFWLVTRGLG